MSLDTPTPRRWSLGRAAPLLAGLILAFVATLATASPARAGDAFRDGFEDELGRIVAHDAATVGRFLLFAPFVHAAHVAHGHPAPRFAPPHPHHRHGHHARYRHGRRHRGHGHVHRRHGPRCDFEHRVAGRRHRW